MTGSHARPPQRSGHLSRNPATGIKAPRVPHVEMDFLTPDEVRTLLAAADERHYALLATAVMTGMRQGELLALQWGDIDCTSRPSVYAEVCTKVSSSSRRRTTQCELSP